MIEESNIKSNFIGRDGFRWWVGQIPPMESMSEQFEGQGWGNRFKVRILGYHTLDENELPNEDLPWAIVMLGTTDGTGSANFAKSTKIRPGDVVFGFFIDGVKDNEKKTKEIIKDLISKIFFKYVIKKKIIIMNIGWNIGHVQVNIKDKNKI